MGVCVCVSPLLGFGGGSGKFSPRRKHLSRDLNTVRNSHPDRGHSICKGPNVGRSSAFDGNSKETGWSTVSKGERDGNEAAAGRGVGGGTQGPWVPW